MNAKGFVSAVGIFLMGAVVGQWVARNSPGGPTSAPKHVSPIAQAPLQISDCSPTSSAVFSTPEHAFSNALAQDPSPTLKFSWLDSNVIVPT